ncbi:MAG: MoxR family ATPase [Patescibacteria group bacterium]
MDEKTAREKIYAVEHEVKKWLFGIDPAIHNLLMCLFTLVPYTSKAGRKELGQAHALLIDLPGVGKTDLIRGFAFAIGGKYALITGGPEKTEGEVVGKNIYIAPLGKFILQKGPIFRNLILFDEINRTHPKGQSAFLQAMEERLATIGSIDLEAGGLKEDNFPLFPISDDPNEKDMFFWVMATQNPLEQQGTYPLPEAQRDRFTASLSIGFPQRENEKMIRARNVLVDAKGERLQIEQVLDLKEAILISQLILETVSVPGRGNNGSDLVDEYIMRLIENSRPGSDKRLHSTDELKEFVDENLKAGISPRANFHFEALARTRAFFEGRMHVDLNDIKYVAPLIMTHRLITSPIATGANIKEADIVKKILEGTEVPS